MWDSVFAHREDLARHEFLPGGVLWRVERWWYEGGVLEIQFQESGGSRKKLVSFEPVYFSAADEFVEAYGGMESAEAIRWKRSGSRLAAVKNFLLTNCPERELYSSLQAYEVSAMEWTLRFVCLSPPTVKDAA